jgi:hypothetical protein
VLQNKETLLRVLATKPCAARPQQLGTATVEVSAITGEEEENKAKLGDSRSSLQRRDSSGLAFSLIFTDCSWETLQVFAMYRVSLGVSTGVEKLLNSLGYPPKPCPRPNIANAFRFSEQKSSILSFIITLF